MCRKDMSREACRRSVGWLPATVLVTILALSLIGTPAVAGESGGGNPATDPVAILRGPAGEIAVLEAFSPEGGLVYVEPAAGEQPLVIVLDHVQGGSWRLVPDDATGSVRLLRGSGEESMLLVTASDRVFPASESGIPRERARALAAGLLDAVLQEAGELPGRLARVRAGLEPVTPRPQHLRSPAAPPVSTKGGCLSAQTRGGCDNCCDDRWHENRDDCRDEFPGTSRENWIKQQRCMQHAALELANCVERCSLKPVKPKPPGQQP